PSTSYRDDLPEVDMSLRKRDRFTAPTDRFEGGESSAATAARQPGLDVAPMDATHRRSMYREVGYGIKDVWDDMVREIEGRASTTLEDLSQRVTNLSTTLAHDTHEIYDQPLPDDASPTALSLGYIADSDLEEDPEDAPEEDPVDYHADRGDDDDELSDDDDDDDEQEDSEDDDEEEEHPALVDSSAVPVNDHVPSAEDIEALETDESAPTPVSSPRRRTARKAARIRLKAASLPTHHLSEIPSPPLLLPSTSYRDDLPEVDMSLRKRDRFTAPTDRFEGGESSAATAARQPGLDVAPMDATHRRSMYREVGYGIKDVWDDMVREIEGTTLEDLSQRVTNLSTTLAHDTHEIYVRLED
nr:hypothetical protein [Tanacetum cinerariifolium]